MKIQEYDKEERKQYFMVRVWEGRPPKKKHETLLSAQKEAERLSKMTGKPATVLSSIGRVVFDGEKLLWGDARPGQSNG